MAGERKGKACEALIKVALEIVLQRTSLKGSLFWNRRPDSLSVEPDFTIGTDSNAPTHIFLVTHQSSEKESNRKYWRNIGEIVEAKTRLPTMPRVYSIVFKATIKPNILAFENASYDGSLVIGSMPYGKALTDWVDSIADRLPVNDTEKADEIARQITSGKSSTIVRAFRKLVDDLTTLVDKESCILNGLWAHERTRSPGASRMAQDTFLRRGFGKALLFPSLWLPDRWVKCRLDAADTQLAITLGFAGRSLAGMRVTDSELLWVSRSLSYDSAKYIRSHQPIERMQVWIDALYDLPLLPAQIEWIRSNWDELSTGEGLFLHLQQCANSPRVYAGGLVKNSKRNWLYHLLFEVLKALSGKQQGYGLSVLLQDLSTLANDMEHVALVQKLASKCGISRVEWRDDRGISLGLGDWANGPSAQRFPLYDDDLARVADSLARRLCIYSSKALVEIESTLPGTVISTNLESKVLSYRLFDPVGTLIEGALEKGAIPWRFKQYEASCFAQWAQSQLRHRFDPRSGGTSLIHAKNTFINWQSATDEGKDHKVKELCGRAAALRYSWHPKKETYVPREGLRNLCLVVDGLWTQQDLDTLARGGWDEIFYPDEMDKLVRAIV